MYLSLRAKGLIFVTLVFSAFALVWIMQSRSLTTDFFSDTRRTWSDEDQRVFHQVFADARERINFLGVLLAQDLSGQGGIGAEGWETLMLDQDLAYLGVQAGSKKIERGQYPFDTSEALKDWSRVESLKQDEALTVFRCLKQNCYAIYQIRSYTLMGDPVSILAVQSISPLVLAFRRFINSELIVLRGNAKAHQQVLLTSNTPYLSKSLPDLVARHGHSSIVESGEHVWYIHPLQLERAEFEQPLRFLAVREITSTYHLFHDRMFKGLEIIALAWLVSIALLYYLLLRPVRQIESIHKAVEYLPAHDFDRMNALLKERRQAIFRDELSDLQKHLIEVGQHLKEAVDELAYLAHNDPLTGLPNLNAFYKALEKGLEEKRPLGVILVDINRFKQINEVYGYEAGNRLLKQVGQQLNDYLAAYKSSVFHLSADEYAALVFNFDEIEMRALLERLATSMGGLLKLEDQEHAIDYTVSVAGLLVGKDEQLRPNEVLLRVNIAMSKAKHKGQPRWHLYNHAEDDNAEQVQRELQLTREIREALDNDRFQLYLQPIMDLHKGTISHYEALIRMPDGQGGFVSPAEFIPVAERYHLIGEIDRWVLRTGFTILAKYPDAHIGINLSAPTVQSPQLLELITGVHKNFPSVAPEQVIFELTETAAVNSLKTVFSNLTYLRKLGYRVALDDFGVGFSSFGYLSSRAFDFVKLDGAYVRHLDTSEQDRTFVHGLSLIVHAYGMKAVAEFVENEEIVRLLKELGVDYAQGYHVGKPAPWQEWLEKQPD